MTSVDHPGAYAYGVATLTLDGTVLDVDGHHGDRH